MEKRAAAKQKLKTEPLLSLAQFKKIFSIPSTPNSSFAPGQYFDFPVPKGKKLVLTDIYLENNGGGFCLVEIMQQTGPNGFEVRYSFKAKDNETLVLNFTTGLPLGDDGPIQGSIRILNSSYSKASVLPRINGYFVG